MKKQPHKTIRKIKTKGLVIPTNWDDSGNVSAVIISTHNEEEYTVELNKKGRELLSLIREPVRVSGFLRSDTSNKIIDIEEYKVISS